MMTRFELLEDAHLKSKEEFNAYKEDCHDFAEELYNEFVKFLEVPNSNVHLLTIGFNGEYEPIAPLYNAMAPIEKGFWHFCIGLSFGNNETLKNELSIFHFLIKHTSKKYIAKLGMEGKPYHIKRKSKDPYKAFFEFVFKETLSGLDKRRYQLAEDMQNKDAKIGFKISSI